jgi:hypothetical protein
VQPFAAALLAAHLFSSARITSRALVGAPRREMRAPNTVKTHAIDQQVDFS